MIRTYIDNMPTNSYKPSYSSSDYTRKLYFYNYTVLDFYIVDRSNTSTFIKGVGSSPTGDTGFKVRVEREYSSSVAMDILTHLTNKAKITELTEDEIEDVNTIKSLLDMDRKVIKLDKVYTLNIGSINTQGFYYDERLDVCIYRVDSPLPKEFPYENIRIQEPKVKEKTVSIRGLIDIFVIDNKNYYSNLYTKVAEKLISIPIFRDLYMQAGVYIRIEEPNDLDTDINAEYKTYQGLRYKFYELDRINELSIYNNQSEAFMSDKLSQERNIELADKQHEIYKLKAELNKENLNNAKLIAELEKDNLLLKHELELMKTRYKAEEMKDNHEVHRTKSKLELLKLQYQINQEHRNEKISIEQGRTVGQREALKRRYEEEDFNRRMELLDKDMKVKSMKLESDILNASNSEKDNGYKDVQEACKTAGSVLNVLQTAGTLFKFLI